VGAVNAKVNTAAAKNDLVFFMVFSLNLSGWLVHQLKVWRSILNEIEAAPKQVYYQNERKASLT